MRFAPSRAEDARLETLADAFPAGASVDRTTGEKERRVDWRALMDACGPSAALLAQEKEAGAAAGSTVALRALACRRRRQTPPSWGAPRESTTASSSMPTTKPSTATSKRWWRRSRDISSRACAIYAGNSNAPRTIAGPRAPAFGAAIAAAGYGPRTFGSAELRWAASACHHPFVEDAVLYPKYVAMVLVGIEREVYRRRARGRTREGDRSVAAEDAERSAWARETVRAAADAVKAVEREVAARVSTR